MRSKPMMAIAIVAALTGGVLMPAQAADWEDLGPKPILTGPYTGRTSAIVASPTDPDTYWVGAASGGVWRTTDGGQSWTPLTSNMPTNQIGALALDPADENTIYAGTGEANFANHCYYGLGLYKSTDGGDSWEILGADTFSGRTFSRVVVSHADSDVLYASIMQAGGFPALAAAKGHPQKDGPYGVFRSTDGGATWEHLTGGLPAENASDVWMDPADASVLYAAIGDIFGIPENGIYKSTDGGDSWVKLTSGLPTNIGRITLAIAPSDPDRLYTIMTNVTAPNGGGATTNGVFRSNDGGANWVRLSAGNFQATYGWYLSTAIVDPTNPNRIYVGGLTLLRSDNAGSSFGDVTPPHVDMHGLAWDASGRLLSANDGGLHRSSNLGGSWTALNDGLGVVQFYSGLSVHPRNEPFLIGGTQDNGTNRRENNGTWTRRLGGDGGLTALADGILVTIFGQIQGTGNIYMSNNEGGSFFGRSTGINRGDRNAFFSPIVYHPDDWRIVYCGTQRVYRSTNNGDRWGAISGDLTGGSGAIQALAIAPTDPDTLWASTNDGRVQVSRDAGFNWDLKLSDIPSWPRVTKEITAHPTDDATAYLSVWDFGEGRVRKTTDYGDTWEFLDGNLPEIPANVVAIHKIGERQATFVGMDRDIYVTWQDSGHWSNYGRNMPNSPVIDLVIDQPFGRLVAGTLGRGAWSVPLPNMLDPDEDGDYDLRDFTLFQECYSGSYDDQGYEEPSEECLAMVDYDLDRDVDTDDLQALTASLEGPQ